MGQVFEYQIPVLHPVVVHIPVALLVMMAVLVLVWAMRGSAFWLRAAAVVSVPGSLGALLAQRTGSAMEEESAGAPLVDALLPIHQQAAEWTVWVSCLVALCLVGLSIRSGRMWPHRRKVPVAVRLALLLAALAAAALVGWTAHVGGIMVWGVPS